MPRSPRPLARWAPLAVAFAVPSVLFLALPPLSSSGMWDPYELDVADLARRIALNLHHAPGLALDGANNSMPHLNDLGRPQLPFSSIALGFKLFGLHEWAGRLPLALWGIAGVLATYAFVARIFDRRAGAYAAVALSTMPLYLVQARAMLGDVCTMAGLAMAFGGLSVAVFDRDDEGPTPAVRRLPWIALAAAGLFVGFESRGGLLGLGVPLLAVGLAWAVARVAVRAGGGGPDRAGDVAGALSLAAGACVALLAVRAVGSPAAAKDLDPWVGALVHTPSRYPTFDAWIGAVGHALAPWSAFLPFAFGRLLLAPRVESGAAAERESHGRVAVLVGSAVVLVAQGWLAARTEAPVAFAGPALCAVACAVALRDFERGAHASIAVGVGTLVVAGVLHHDFHEVPAKAYLAFGVAGGASFPERFETTSVTLWWIVLGGFALCALLTWIERDARRRPFDPAAYLALVRGARRAHDGLPALVWAAVVAGASVAALLVLAGARTHAQWLPSMSSTMRDVVLNAWWVLAVLPLGAPALMLACDAWQWAFGGHRGSGLVVGGAVVGFVLCFFYYPALAGQISPKEAFEAYRRACAGAPLGLLGVGGRAAAYYAGGAPAVLGDPAAAQRWLASTAPGEPRRCLAMKADELPRMNALWREHGPGPRENVPVLDARGSQVLLVASSLRGTEASENPLEPFVLSAAPPRTQRPLGVNLDDQLEVVGLDVTDEGGRLVDAVRPGRTYHLRTTYRVLSRPTTEWRPFVHIDGYGRRHNGDHKVMEGRYPMSLWLPGDVLVDDDELRLEPNFTPGTYRIWFGLAVGDRCTDRLRVKSGANDGCNRIDGGTLHVL